MDTNADGLPLFLDPYVQDENEIVGDGVRGRCVSRCPSFGPFERNFNRTNFDTDADGIPDGKFESISPLNLESHPPHPPPPPFETDPHHSPV